MDSFETQPSGRLIIISGPSGAGKSTVVRELLTRCPVPLMLSVSATTRAPRPTETDGREYFFLSEDEFQRRRDAGEFLETKQVFSIGHWYGTLREQVASGLAAGKWVILEIDVEGAMCVLDEQPPELVESWRPVTLFVHPGGMEELERRLRNRGTESDDAIASRLERAAAEMAYLPRYRYEIINQSVDNAVTEICQILQDQRETTPCSKN